MSFQQLPISIYQERLTTTYSLRLQEYGGIYLDIDTFVFSSFKEAGLLAQDFVLGMEAQPLDFEYGFEEDEMRPKGLCNAIIVARKGSSFLEKWIQSYEWFDPDIWSDHSVVSGFLDTFRGA